MSCTDADVRDGSREKPFIMRQSVTFSFEATIAGTTLDDYTGSGSIRINKYSPENPATATLVITKDPAKRGKYTGSLGATVTANIPPGTYIFDVIFERTSPTPDPDDVIFGGSGYIVCIPLTA